MKKRTIIGLSAIMIGCAILCLTGCAKKETPQRADESGVSTIVVSGESLFYSETETHFNAAETSFSTENSAVSSVTIKTKATEPTEATTVPKTKNSTNAIGLPSVYDAYLREIKRQAQRNLGGNNEEDTRFYLYDFDKNGIPELIIDHGYRTNTFEEGHGVYTYNEKGLVFLGSVSAYGSYFYDTTPGDNEFDVLCFYHDHSAEYHYRIEGGKLIETTVKDWHDVVHSEDDEHDEYLQESKRVEPYLIVAPDAWPYADEADAYFSNL